LVLVELAEDNGADDAGQLAHHEVDAADLFVVQTLLDLRVGLEFAVLIVLHTGVGQVVAEVVDRLEYGAHDCDDDDYNACGRKPLLVADLHAGQAIQEEAPARGGLDTHLVRDHCTQNAHEHNAHCHYHKCTSHHLRAHLIRHLQNGLRFVLHRGYLQERVARKCDTNLEAKRNRQFAFILKKIVFGLVLSCSSYGTRIDVVMKRVFFVETDSIELGLSSRVEREKDHRQRYDTEKQEYLVDRVEADQFADHGAEDAREEHGQGLHGKVDLRDVVVVLLHLDVEYG